MPRITGQVFPQLPRNAPLTLRLPAEVYALDGDDYFVTPGARLEVGSRGRLYETMSGFPGGSRGMLIAGGAAFAAWWFLLRKKKGRR